MSATRIVAGLGLGVLLLAGCEPAKQEGPISLTPGTVEYQLRQQQLNAARNDPGRAQQNPVATGVTVEGIQRQGTSAGGSVNPVATGVGVGGIERAGQLGAPATR